MERWQQIESLFQKALERHPAELNAWLREACHGDSDLRREVDSLLANYKAATDFRQWAAAAAAKLIDGPASLEPGHCLGPYRIECFIDAGGMGEVYRATDTRLHRQVAIKVSAGRFTERFEREARVIASLNHPNICQLHDVGPNYLVMELVKGPTLAERIRKGALPVDEALGIARQMAEALEAAHEKGIVHRDLKPANIKITPEGAVKLLDFGLAKAVEETPTGGQASDLSTMTVSNTRAGVILGTAAYMSPEQARGAAVDKRSDIWAFGCVLYEMLSGRQAFRGENSISTMAAILHTEPRPLDSPAALQQIVKQCLSKSPGQRYQTMAQVRAALQSISRRLEQTQPSIAVLPFANMSLDKEQEFFSDGLAEEIINLLAQIVGLKVIARTSAFAFKGKNEDIRRIAEALGVTHVLEGSVRRAGNRLRITAELIHAADGTNLWSQRYDREMTDVFAIQDEIAAAIVRALKGKLIGETVFARGHQPSLPAYDAFLKARHYYFKTTAVTRARAYFEQEIARF